MYKRWAIVEFCALILATACQGSITDVRPRGSITPRPALHEEGVDEPFAADANSLTHGSSAVSRAAHVAAVSTWIDSTHHGWSIPGASANGFVTLTQWMSDGSVWGTAATDVNCGVVTAYVCSSGNKQISAGYDCALNGWKASASVQTVHNALWPSVTGTVNTTARDECGNPPSTQEEYADTGGGLSEGTPTHGAGCYEWWHYNGFSWHDMGEVCF